MRNNVLAGFAAVLMGVGQAGYAVDRAELEKLVCKSGDYATQRGTGTFERTVKNEKGEDVAESVMRTEQPFPLPDNKKYDALTMTLIIPGAAGSSNFELWFLGYTPKGYDANKSSSVKLTPIPAAELAGLVERVKKERPDWSYVGGLSCK